MKKIFTILVLLATVLSTRAQEEKIVVKLSGRILLDGGLFDAKHEKEKINSGVAIPDMRIGFRAQYEKWKAKVDIGYSYGKVGMKDVIFDYDFDKSNILRVGYFVHQFGLQSSTSSSFKITMEEPNSNQAFFNSRLIGAMFIHKREKFFGTFSLFAESDAMKMSSDKLGNEGFGAMSRLLFRPLCQPGRIFHLGISGAFETPRYNADKELNHRSFTLGTQWPTRIAKVTAQEATITHAGVLYKFTPELCAAYGRLGLEGQYYYVNIKRNDDLPSYKASGAYGLVRGLIKGDNYKYTSNDSGIDTPDPGNMELVAAYNYTDLSDCKADIHGGRLNDWSLTYNYYINKYMIWRVRASYTHVSDRTGFEDNNVKILETRLQIKF